MIMAAMARAASVGGAKGIRAEGPEDIAAIRNAVSLPIIGLWKQNLSDYQVYITPSLAAARAVCEAGADIVAIDATLRPHPDERSAADLIAAIHQELEVSVMADISTVEEGLAAAEAGADILSTTLSGYTPYSPQSDEPDLELVHGLSQATDTPVMAEGRIATPEQAHRALKAGAYAVVVGTAITRPEAITARFVEALKEG
jgi:N-acylglucosamine-6-phosphate 2-epimerase